MTQHLSASAFADRSLPVDWPERKRQLDAEWLARKPADYPSWRIWLLEWGYAQQRLERARQKELYHGL